MRKILRTGKLKKKMWLRTILNVGSCQTLRRKQQAARTCVHVAVPSLLSATWWRRWRWSSFMCVCVCVFTGSKKERERMKGRKRKKAWGWENFWTFHFLCRDMHELGRYREHLTSLPWPQWESKVSPLSAPAYKHSLVLGVCRAYFGRTSQ